jgi:hypothetical protein
MSKRSASVVAAAVAAVVAATLGLAGSASGAASLPTLTIALNGVRGISLSGSTTQGAVSIESTFTGKAPKGPDAGPAFGIVQLKPGMSIQKAAAAVESHRGDLNALTPYGTLLVSQSAPSTVETVLTPGRYVALNDSGNGQPGFAPFTVKKSSSAAALPAARATETAMEFGFRGPTVLHNGTIVRAQNHGWLVHMIVLVGVRDAATGRKVISLLRADKNRQAQKLANGDFVDLLGPASPGAMQQQVLNANPGYYVEACFMDNQDGREHANDGMERLVRIVG